MKVNIDQGGIFETNLVKRFPSIKATLITTEPDLQSRHFNFLELFLNGNPDILMSFSCLSTLLQLQHGIGAATLW